MPRLIDRKFNAGPAAALQVIQYPGRSTSRSILDANLKNGKEEIRRDTKKRCSKVGESDGLAFSEGDEQR